MDVEDLGQRARAPSDEAAPVASLAHEINNPLESLLNLLYLIEAEAALTENGRRYLALAQQEVQRLSKIALGVIREFRSVSGPEDTNVPQLLRSVVDFYKAGFDSRGIGLQTRFCPAGKIAVYPGPLRQMFANLLLNAADAMPQGGKIYARVSSAREWTGLGRHGLRVTIADNGCGIAPKDLPRITDTFFTTKGLAGTGLGLALLKDTVAKHDGVLRVRSSTKPGRSGSVLAVFLPAA